MFFDRTVGGDIGWPDSKTWLNAAEDYIEDKVERHAKKVAIAVLLSACGPPDPRLDL
jgi:hypothetical protein